MLGQKGPTFEQRLQSQKTEYDEILNEKFKGLVFRSKTKWYEQGEHSSKYYFNLERANFNRRTMKQVFDSDGSLQNSQEKILDIQAAFFSRLYVSDSNVKFDLNFNSSRHKPPKEAKKFEVEISLDEMSKALASLNKDKTPGADGLPAELYQHFWSLLGLTLLEAFKFARQTGILHISSRRGVISLIPEKNRDSRYVENWHPITLHFRL